MAFYCNQKQNASISGVEFAPVADGNFSFFSAANPFHGESVKAWLTSPEVGQELVAETIVDGCPMLVMHGQKSPEALLKLMEDHGDHFVLKQQKRTFDPWVARAALGFTGQSLQLVSSFMGHKGDPVQWDTALFALSNLAANTIALVYGAQKSEDVYRLRFLKDKFNQDLSQNLSDSDVLPDITENRLELHGGKPRLTTGIHNFLERNSVRVGELALRYVGSIALTFPKYGWERGWQEYRSSGSISAGLGEAKNRDTWTYNVGVISALGKTVALFSKEADPYNPKPHTWLDTVREKLTFPVGGLIEAGAFSMLTYNRFSSPKHKIYFRGKPYRDYLGGIGGAMFVAAYLIRSGMAKFSEKDVNMDELYAHVTDSLAAMPPEKLPQLMADTAAAIKAHFKDKPIDYGTVFTRLMNDAYRYHHIALQNATAQQVAADTPKPDNSDANIPESQVEARRTLIPPRRQAMGNVDPSSLSHTDKISTEIKVQPGIGV